MVGCDTYPDFRMTAERIEPLLTERTKFVLLNSPGNPTGVVLDDEEVRRIVELCRDRGVQLVSDEIYDEFVFPDSARPDGTCPSPGRFDESTLVIRGFGKTYGCTGWRLGYAAGPRWLVDQMVKLQQFTFVCAPTPLQLGGGAGVRARQPRPDRGVCRPAGSSGRGVVAPHPGRDSRRCLLRLLRGASGTRDRRRDVRRAGGRAAGAPRRGRRLLQSRHPRQAELRRRRRDPRRGARRRGACRGGSRPAGDPRSFKGTGGGPEGPLPVWSSGRTRPSDQRLGLGPVARPGIAFRSTFRARCRAGGRCRSRRPCRRLAAGETGEAEEEGRATGELQPIMLHRWIPCFCDEGRAESALDSWWRCPVDVSQRT